MTDMEKTQPAAETQEEKKELDFTNLEERLEELTANDYSDAERECRMAADPASDIMYSSNFRARLVARAMGVPYGEIRALKIKTYAAVIERTLLFLLGSLAETAIRRSN